MGVFCIVVGGYAFGGLWMILLVIFGVDGSVVIGSNLDSIILLVYENNFICFCFKSKINIMK